MELLLVNHPLDCPICDQAGECKLQDYAFEYGVGARRARASRAARSRRTSTSGRRSCSTRSAASCAGAACASAARCPSTGELAVFERGDHSVIETFPGVPLDNDYSMNVADICPVGALTTKDFRFKIRVWFLDDVPGVCTGCANGCNVHLGVANNKVYRYVPRRNDAVNDTWICDEGRMSYKRDRRARPHADARSCAASSACRRRATSRRAIAAAAQRLAACSTRTGAGAIAGIASAHATNEDLFVFRRLLDGARRAAPRACAVPRGRADDLLIKAEKAANAAGARALGFGDAAAARASGSARGGVARPDRARPRRARRRLPRRASDALARLDTLIAARHAPLRRSSASRTCVFPTRVAAEKHGTLTNHAGRVQRVRARRRARVRRALARARCSRRSAARSASPASTAASTRARSSKALAQSVPAFAGAVARRGRARGRAARGSRARDRRGADQVALHPARGGGGVRAASSPGSSASRAP